MEIIVILYKRQTCMWEEKKEQGMNNLHIEKIAKLVERVKKKEDDAFAELYNHMNQKIYFFAKSIVKDEYLAQDVVQETFISVYNNIHKLENNRLFVAWINRITYNCALKILNSKEMKAIPIEDNIVEVVLGKNMQSHSSSDPLEAALTKEKGYRLAEHIYQLPMEFRVTLILRYLEELKLEEIAISMGCSVGTVKSRLSRGKKALRKSLASEGAVFTAFMVGSFSLRYTMNSYAAEAAVKVPKAETMIKLARQSEFVSENGITELPPSTQKNMVCLLSAAAIIGVTVLGGLIWCSFGADIEVTGDNGKYTNRNIEVGVAVNAVLPVKSVIVSTGEEKIPINVTEKEKVYEAVITHNGTYRVEVELINGHKTEKELQISRIDKKGPEMYRYFWDTEENVFVGYLSDDLSGPDYGEVYLEMPDKERQQPVIYDEKKDRIEFPLYESTSTITIYDRAGNRTVYEIIPHRNGGV